MISSLLLGYKMVVTHPLIILEYPWFAEGDVSCPFGFEKWSFDLHWPHIRSVNYKLPWCVFVMCSLFIYLLLLFIIIYVLNKQHNSQSLNIICMFFNAFIYALHLCQLQIQQPFYMSYIHRCWTFLFVICSL